MPLQYLANTSKIGCFNVLVLVKHFETLGLEMELEYKEVVKGTEVVEGETSGEKLKLNLALTQMKNEKPKNAAGSCLLPSLYLSNNVC